MPQYGISTWLVADLSTDEAIERLAASGFTEVELSADQSPLVKAWENDPVGTCRRLEEAGMSVRSVHTPGPGRHLDDPDEEVRQASIAANLDYFGWMNACGIEEIVIHPTSSVDISTDERLSASRSHAVESLRVLAGSAEEVGIRMAVENLYREPRPGSTMASILEMIAGLGDHVGICLDVGHSEMAGLNLLDELRTATAPGKLFSLHLHDVNQEGRDHFMPAEGRIDFGPLLSHLDDCRFTGGRMLEISPPQSEVGERLRQADAVRREWEAR